MAERVVKAWHIGEYGEIFAASSEEDVRKYYTDAVGESEASECFDSEFTELSPDELDAERTFFDHDEPTTFRKEALSAEQWPTQISTTYN